MLPTLTLATLLLAPLTGTPHTAMAARDVVSLNNGKTVEGLVLYEDDDEVIVRVGSSERSFDREDVASVDSTARRLQAFLSNLANVDPFAANAADQWGLLAEMTDDAGLVKEARLCWMRVLLADPDRLDAHNALGHTSRADKRLVKLGGKYVTWDAFVEAHEDWQDAWMLETTHFTLQTNLELGAAIDAAFDLELSYANYYNEVARPLKLLEMTEPVEAEVHARDSSFRARTPGEKGRFDHTTETLMIDASPAIDGYDRGILFHEVIHALLYFSIRQQTNGKNALPGWLDEGLAEYFAGQAKDGAGRVLEFGRARHLHNVRKHNDEADPLSLKRLLNLESGEFSIGGDTALRYAQSYTLIHFLLTSDGAAFRDPFFEYLRGAFAGKGSASSFKKTVARDLDAVEAEWTAHVAALAH